MIVAYTADTPNGIKLPIALEELGLDYRIVRVALSAGEQKTPAFMAMNPNGRIPVMFDDAGPLGDEALFESGAILWDLAERYPGLMPADPAERLRALQWLMLQVAGVGPMFGQAGWFLRSAPQRVDFAVDRYVGEARRLAGVLDRRLQEAPWLAGSTYTVADIAHFGWIRSASYADVDLADFPALAAWQALVAARPAVQRAVARLAAQR